MQVEQTVLVMGADGSKVVSTNKKFILEYTKCVEADKRSLIKGITPVRVLSNRGLLLIEMPFELYSSCFISPRKFYIHPCKGFPLNPLSGSRFDSVT